MSTSTAVSRSYVFTVDCWHDVGSCELNSVRIHCHRTEAFFIKY